MLLLRKKLYIFDLISFQYFFVDVWTSFTMFNELTQILRDNTGDNLRQARAYVMPRTHTNRFKNTFIPSMCT